MNRLFIIIFLTAWIIDPVFAQPSGKLPYKDPSLSIDDRVKDLLSRMTLEEKFWQMFMIPGDLSHPNAKEHYKYGIFGFQTQAQAVAAGNAAGQMLSYEGGKKNSNATETARKINEMQRFFVEETRLGIPIIAFDEALHGLVRNGATAFPQSIGMAASFNPELMYQVAEAIAVETKSRGIRDILSPVVNIANDVRWGRTEETYGEDPFLSSKMGVAFVSAFEKMGVITSPKHFLANVGDGGRDSYPIYWNERQLREIYLPPFAACFKEGGARSVMTAYNSIDGVACSANAWLLRRVLKEELGFKGFVISDAGATGGTNVLHMTAKDYAESTQQAIEGGLDVMFQTSYNHYTLFIEAFEKGMIDPDLIDDAVSRVLRMKFELGLFENPYIEEGWAEKVNNSKEHQELNVKMARETFVLLKNEKNRLPLDKNKIRSIALIGKDIAAGRLGGYSGPGCDIISMLDGFKNYLEKSQVTIHHASGVDLHYSEYTTIPRNCLSATVNGQKQEGLLGEYYANAELKGTPEYTEVNRSMNFGWTLYSPNQEKIPYDCYSIRWTGKITSPVAGTYKIGVTGNDGYRIYIDGKLILDNWEKVSFATHAVSFQWEKGKAYDIRIEYRETIGNARFNLVWGNTVKNTWKDDIQQAVQAAKKSDVVIVAAGIHEGEFQDRGYLSLPGKQVEMIEAVIATGKPVIVLLVGGSAITMDQWSDKVDAIMDVWYPGDKGGKAVAEVVFGEYSPSGKLPITFPRHESQLPLVYNHRPTGRGDDYHNLTGQPLYPFGYGLSYTTFEYSDMTIDQKTIGVNESTKVRCKVKNIGKYKGAEVVQLYIKDILASLSQPVIQLKGFEKVMLNPGEEKEVEFTITPNLLKLLNQEMKWVVEPGEFRIMIGSSCKDIRLRDNLMVK